MYIIIHNYIIYTITLLRFCCSYSDSISCNCNWICRVKSSKVKGSQVDQVNEFPKLIFSHIQYLWKALAGSSAMVTRAVIENGQAPDWWSLRDEVWQVMKVVS